MYYMEFLCVRKTLYWLAGLLAAAVAIVSWAIASPAHGSPHHFGTIPVAALMAGATFVSAIIAMIFGCALARQNDGHLPLVWTRPVSREQYIITVTAVHLAGIAIAFVMTLAAAISVFAIFGALHALTMAGEAPVDAGIVGRMVLFPLAWYGLVLAITASTRGGAGFMAFGAWIVGSVLVGFDASHLFGGAAGIVINVIDHINPLYYFSGHFDDSGRNQSLVSNVDVAMVGLAAIAVAGYAAAIAQWRRLEA
ncbi:MAG TPA: hypothetical protein VID19_05750 [Candidatus Eremiobacteraceae bacterium]